MKAIKVIDYNSYDILNSVWKRYFIEYEKSDPIGAKLFDPNNYSNNVHYFGLCKDFEVFLKNQGVATHNLMGHGFQPKYVMKYDGHTFDMVTFLLKNA